MAKRSKLPTSKATNAYDLLTDVKKLILEEPKRYNQMCFIARTSEPDSHIKRHRMPSCGTVACVAGWVATLKHGNDFHYNQTRSIASDILGLDSWTTDELFDGNAFNYDESKVQTAVHARAGAKHIATFQAKYATQLKRKKV